MVLMKIPEKNTDDNKIKDTQSSVNDTVISSVLRTDENTDDKNLLGNIISKWY